MSTLENCHRNSTLWFQEKGLSTKLYAPLSYANIHLKQNPRSLKICQGHSAKLLSITRPLQHFPNNGGSDLDGFTDILYTLLFLFDQIFQTVIYKTNFHKILPVPHLLPKRRCRKRSYTIVHITHFISKQ